MKIAGTIPGPYTTYVPKPRQQLFHSVPPLGPKLIKGAVGGLGGGKSTCCEQELVELCMRQPGGSSVAVRKSISNRAELSVLKDLREMLTPGGHAVWTPSQGCFKFHNGHNLYILPGEDWERLGSVELCNFFVQEAQEISKAFFDTLSARLRHKAGQIDGRPCYRGFFDARGVRRNHWINHDFIEKAWNVDDGPAARKDVENPNFVYIRFRSYDNDALPEGYVSELIREHRHDIAWLKVFIEGEIGFDIEGRPVYGDAYDPSRHVAKITQDSSLPILRGWDFGYRAPGVLWAQYTRSGRLLVLAELAPNNLSTDALIERVVALQAEHFPYRDSGAYLDFGDDQGNEAQSTSEVTDIEKIETQLGTEVRTRKGNIEIGLNVVRGLMLKTVKQGSTLVPRFAVDQSCMTTVDALGGAYFYPEDKPNSPPIKGGSYVAVMDALRYIAQLVVEEGTIPQDGSRYPERSSFANYGRR